MTATADAVVIGAGVIGASIAYQLAVSNWRVAVVDAGSGPGHGSTSASSAVVRFHYSTSPGVATAWEAKHAWEQWSEHLRAVAGEPLARYVRTGVFVIDTPDIRRDAILQHYATFGIDYEELGPRDVAARFPFMDVGSYYPPKAIGSAEFFGAATGEISGFFTAEGGFVDDPVLAARNLIDAARRHGAELLTGRPVAEIGERAGRVCAVGVADGSHISTPVVINAAGPHSAAVNALLGADVDFRVNTRPLRQEVHTVAVPRAASLESGFPVVHDGDLGIYFRPQPGGSMLVGGVEAACDELQWLDNPDTCGGAPTKHLFDTHVWRLARRLPVVHVPERVQGVVGVYDVSTDWIPIYDRTSIDGYYVAIGTSGNQFKNAPAVGSLMRALVEACENGHDHDGEPVVWRAKYTSEPINLAHYSRLREPNTGSSGTVLG